MAVPSRSLRRALESIGDRMPADLGVLVLSKGLLAPHGTPAEPARRRAHRRAPGRLPGRPGARGRRRAPRRARHRCVSGPHLRRAARQQPAAQPGLDVRHEHATSSASSSPAPRRTPPRWPPARRWRTGRTQPARRPGACTRSATRSPTSAAPRPRASRARPARATSSRPCWRHTAATGARASCSRRASSPREIPEILGQVPESLYAVPVLARAMSEAGVRSTATAQLAALAEGRIGPDQWVEMARRSRAGSTGGLTSAPHAPRSTL